MMSNRNFYYKKVLKENILSSLEKLNPRHQLKDIYREDCPECGEEDGFAYIPSHKYGRCVECSHEVGFEYYTTVMGSQEEAYKELKKRIEKALEGY